MRAANLAPPGKQLRLLQWACCGVPCCGAAVTGRRLAGTLARNSVVTLVHESPLWQGRQHRERWVQVMAQLLAEQELPWEGQRLRSRPAVRKRLGVFKKPVLALLHRNPAQRSSMHDFCAACDSLFSSTSPLSCRLCIRSPPLPLERTPVATLPLLSCSTGAIAAAAAATSAAPSAECTP